MVQKGRHAFAWYLPAGWTYQDQKIWCMEGTFMLRTQASNMIDIEASTRLVGCSTAETHFKASTPPSPFNTHSHHSNRNPHQIPSISCHLETIGAAVYLLTSSDHTVIQLLALTIDRSAAHQTPEILYSLSAFV